MTRAPVITPNWRAKMETPPVPCTRIVSPAWTWSATNIAFHAVTAAQGSVEPSSNERCGGRCTRPSWESVTYSASMPSMPPPSDDGSYSGRTGPSSQTWVKMPATQSPSRTRVTPAPTSATSPAPSEQGMSGRRSLRAAA